MTDEDEVQIPDSNIIIEFAAPGAVMILNAQWNNCYPEQLLIAGEYLVRKAKKFMEKAEAEREQQAKIVKPSPNIVVPK